MRFNDRIIKGIVFLGEFQNINNATGNGWQVLPTNVKNKYHDHLTAHLIES
ncbi:hypothetical protein PFDG_04632 [Plasmodium falciparum Dd2]|uniref:Uncharacterized protein n=1 Tax=Plasmodium falciparum (isolate Dd2) TaxID=57267 RepID=A0A0L7M5V8_PLAF4|nr:hypothetical protein PFDG_04632 [Plasmodium falciparum Dd2]